MKKVLLLFVALFMATAVNAQISPITFGPKVGYQTTKLSTDKDVIKSDFKGNMAFGVFARLTIKNFILQPELLYYKSGKTFEMSLWGDTPGLLPEVKPTFTINQSNFALPVLLGYQFIDIPFIKMRANIGPVFYFAVGKTEYSTNLLSGNSVTTKESPSEDMSIGGALNLGIDLWKFTLDVNYSLGLSKVMDNEIKVPGVEQPIKVGDKTKQNIFTVTLGFKII